MKHITYILRVLFTCMAFPISISANGFKVEEICNSVISSSDFNDGDTFVVDGMTYQVLSTATNTCELTKGKGGDVIIPDQISYELATFTVTSIGKNSFAGIAGLKSIVTPNTVTSIGKQAFTECIGLTKIFISKAVTKIGTNAFYGCVGMKTFEVENGNPKFCSVDGVLFNNSRTTLIQYPLGKKGGYTLPNTVSSVSNYAFSGCLGITSVDLNNCALVLGECAFSGCKNLTSVDFGNAVTSIGEGAFGSCISLTSLTMPNTVNHLGAAAFSGCSKLESAVLSNSITFIDEYTFEGCESLKSIEIPNSVTKIWYEAFYQCYNLTSVVLGSGLSQIREFAFGSCQNLYNIVSYNTTPPYTMGNSFSGVDKTKCVLKVPGEAVSAYQTANEWKDFSRIEDMNTSSTILVTSIQLNTNSITLNNGETYKLTTTILPNNADDKSVTWLSNNTSIADVDTNGNVTAVGAGTATITATANDGSGVSASCKVTVTVPTCATPTFSQSGDKLTISCATSGATIYYTIGGATPTNASTKYTGPIIITDNRTIKAIAYADNFNASAVATFTPTSATCQQVVISVSGTTATLSCTTSGATIYYTLDGSTPTTSSSKYAAPITLTHNCTIKAIAVKENMNNSTVSSYTVNTFTAAMPTFSQSGDKLTMSCATSGATIYYTIGGATPTNSSTKYTGPITITDNRTIKAIAYATNFNTSAVATYTPTSATCQQVSISLSGTTATLTCATSGATIYYTLDGTTPTTSSTKYTAPFTLTHNCTIKAVAIKTDMNNSEVASYVYNAFACDDVKMSYDGRYVTLTTVTQGASIRYTTDGSTPTNASAVYTAPFDATGMVTVKAVAMKDNWNDGPCLSQPVPCYSDGRTVWVGQAESLSQALKVCGTANVAAFVWSANEKMPENALTDIDSPNLLLYVNMRSYAPSLVKNVVVGNQAENIMLQDGFDFFCPQQFTARSISYTHCYTMPTPLDGRASGWETITLPFDVQSMTHETNGTIDPFAANDPTTKPFWLGAMTASGFKRAASIEANTPYIICMPNNAEYADEYILAGDVTFSAQNVTVPVTEPKVVQYGELRFVPTTVAVAQDKSVFTINRTGDVLGSMFISDDSPAHPFEAYITLGTAPNAVKAFSISSLMDDLADDIPVISASHTNSNTNVYSASGTLVNTNRQTKGLAKGVYIIGKKKVIVK